MLKQEERPMSADNSSESFHLTKTTIWNFHGTAEPVSTRKSQKDVRACFANLWTHYYCDMFTCEQ